MRENIKRALIKSIESGMYEEVDHDHSARLTDYCGCEAMLINHWTLGVVARVCFSTDEPLIDCVNRCVDELVRQVEGTITTGSVMVHGIKMDDLLRQFDKEYEFIYECDKRNSYVAGYREALEYGDQLIRHDKELVTAFNNHRKDILSSDREVAAFGFAVSELAA